VDISGQVIEVVEKLGWARDVTWPDPARPAAERRRPETAATAS
jgi:stearoyl-CoA desaturase (delta-9 desaturase)